MGLLVTFAMKPTIEKMTRPANMLVKELMQHTMIESLGKGNMKTSCCQSLWWSVISSVASSWIPKKAFLRRESLFLIIAELKTYPCLIIYWCWPQKVCNEIVKQSEMCFCATFQWGTMFLYPKRFHITVILIHEIMQCPFLMDTKLLFAKKSFPKINPYLQTNLHDIMFGL